MISPQAGPAGGSYVLRLTGRCNERCSFCFVMDEIEEGRPISFAQVREQLEKAKRDGYTRVDFFGGEPTSYSFLPDAVRLANELGLEASMATNALKFASRSYCDAFFDRARLLALRVSLYAHEAAVHDRITKVPGSFEKTLAGIGNILRRHWRLGVSVVIHSGNYLHLEAIVRLVHGLGVPGIKLIGLIETDRVRAGDPGLAVALDEIRAPLRRALRAASSLGMIAQLEKLPVCLAPAERALFWSEPPPDGFVKPEPCRGCGAAPACCGLQVSALAREGLPRFVKPLPAPRAPRR